MREILNQNLDYSMYYWVDAILFLLFSITVLYLLLFALASLFKRKDMYPPAKEKSKIAVVILVFESNWDAKKCLNSYLNQDYPSDKYKIFVVATNITQSIQNDLRDLDIDYVICENPKLNRTTLLSHFISELDNKGSFEFIAIHSLYDKVHSTFLSKVNDALYSGCDIVQTHCKVIDEKSTWNIYKSISEEINNSIFRKAHCRLSLSSALSNTGVIISLNVLKMCLKKKTNVGMEKQFEKVILQNNYYIEYLDSVYTYYEKTAKTNTSYNRQKRQYRYHLKNMLRTLFYMPFAILQGNIDYINKLFQWILPPRLALITLIGVFGGLISSIDIFASIKWWVLLVILIATFFIAIPSSLITGRLIKTLLIMPIYILYAIFNIIFKHKKHENSDRSTTNIP